MKESDVKTDKKSSKSSKKYLEHPVNKSLTSEDKIDLYREIVRIRKFEERTLRVYQQGKIGGFLHLYIGQESVATGTISVLGDDDHVITAYRDHGHALAVGMGMNECMAELLGKATGCSKGKGGSMHFFAPDKNYWGGHGIVGGQTPLGAGIAYALKYQKKKGCCLCYLGDGAINQGPYHESLNLAGLWDLPVIYIIENNRYSMGTSLERSSSIKPGMSLAERAEGYNIAWDVVRGNDMYEVRAKTADAVKRAHEESKPTVLEIDTYRYRGHSVSDPDTAYRSKEEITAYKNEHDPIFLFEKQLLSEKVLTDKLIEEINAEAKKEADAAADFAEASPFPTEDEIFDDIYWETDNPEERTSEGKLFFND